MIQAPPGLIARYKYEHEENWSHRRIVAFDGDGLALVMSDEGHRLTPAGQYRNFDGITDQQIPEGDPLTLLLPAGGWRIEYTSDDGSTWSEPLVGWGSKRSGALVALVADSTGAVRDLGHVGGEHRVYHPDSTQPARRGGGSP